MSLLTSLESLDLPRFRKVQILKAWFDPAINGWEKVTTLPKALRDQLAEQFFWSSVKALRVPSSPTAEKALLELSDGKKIESVLMINSKGEYTACISSQVGCAMACDFCATGTMGFLRDLTVDEIVDQIRFWESRSQKHVSNIVLMGMGEPLNNYDNVKKALQHFIEDMEFGKTRITLSTVGVKRGMDKILEDPNWPDVRIAISLHYPIQEKRLSHMPVARQRSLDELKNWCKAYEAKYGNRRHYLTFEYLYLQDNNDRPEDIAGLVKFLRGIDRYKINLIPWNVVNNLAYNRASRERTEHFQNELKKHGIFATIRKSLGIEIDAGCGQLVARQAVQSEGPAKQAAAKDSESEILRIL